MKDIIIALISNSSWPLVALIFLLTLRKQFGLLLNRLSLLKAGTVELQLFQQISSQKLSEEQRSQLKKLTSDELDLFLLVSFSENVGFRYSVPVPNHIFKRRMESLRNAGLIEIYNPENDGTELAQGLTDLGKHVRSILINESTKLLQDSAKNSA